MVAVVAALLVTGACSDDDDGGGFAGLGSGDTGDTGDSQGSVPGPSGDGGLGDLGDGSDTGSGDDLGGGGEGAVFGDSSTFVSNCSSFQGATVSLCECAWEEISSSVSAEEYAAFEEEFLSDPSTSLPSWLTDAVANCT